MSDGKSYNLNQLQVAIDLRGMKNKEFALLIDCPVSTFQSYMNGKRIIPSSFLEKCALKLNVPLSFFYIEDLADLESDRIFYRSFSRIKAAHRGSVESYVKIAMRIDSYFSKYLNMPKFLPIDLDVIEPSSSIAEVASLKLRVEWGLGILPIKNIVSLLERKGLRVYRLPLEVRDVDALSVPNDDGIPFVFLNTGKSAERMRFDAAHELGHHILHHYAKAGTNIENENLKQLEIEADQFSSNFLMPTDAFVAKRPKYPTIDAMIESKKYWNVSLQAFNYKAHKVGLITDWIYRSNCIQINKQGFHRSEPNTMGYDESIFFKKALNLLMEKPDFSIEKMLDELCISKEDFNELTFDSIEQVESAAKKTSKLYIVE